MEAGPYFTLKNAAIILLLIILNAIIRAVHTSLISLNSNRLKEIYEEEGDNKTKSLLKIISDQDRLNQSFDLIDMIISFVIITYFIVSSKSGIVRYSRAFTRRRVDSISSAISWVVFSISANLSSFSITSLRPMIA